MKFTGIPIKHRNTQPRPQVEGEKSEPKFDIPKFNLGGKKAAKTRRKVRNFLIKWSIISGFSLIVLFALMYVIAHWFDQHQIVFQQPVFVKVQTPVYVQDRFALAPIPHAQYIDVDPLTKTSDIDAIVHGHESFNPIQTANLDPISKKTIEALVHNKVVQKFGEAAWPQVKYIIDHESGFDPYIVNKSSGACGLAQALPCSKLPSLDLTDQIYWLMNVYIPSHYQGSVQAAYDHKVATGWY